MIYRTVALINRSYFTKSSWSVNQSNGFIRPRNTLSRRRYPVAIAVWPYACTGHIETIQSDPYLYISLQCQSLFLDNILVGT